MKTAINFPPTEESAPTTATGNVESRRARRPLPSLQRIDSCPRCGWPTLARKGKTLCCGARISELREEIKILKRRCASKKKKTKAEDVSAEGEVIEVLSLTALIGQGDEEKEKE